MKLEKKELDEMKNIVTSYSILQNEFEKAQKQLEEISKKKDHLLKRLDYTHDEELAFYQKLNKKYGEGKLDLNTLEYIQTIK